ncbi:hypothetical protein AMTRI_Chr03g139600 [Amborella trichopoda]
MRRGDVTWQYGTKVNNKGRVRCNVCNKEMGGGIYHLKEHLAWVKGNVTGCKKEPPKVKQQTTKIITGGKEKKVQRERDAEEIGRGSIAEVGPCVRGPTAKELVGPSLEVFKVYWPGTEVTIMTDGWKDKSHRYLVNFLIGCLRGIVYHSSIDLSRRRHTGRLICARLDKIEDEVGPENVVQVVTNNAANYKKAGLMLMKRRPNLYWTPCAAHCINSMLKEIGKLKRVKYCILKSKLITKSIACERVRESTTRFATAFLTIQSILVNKAGLRSMMRSNEWQTDRAAMSQLGRQVETTFLDRGFWTRCNHVVSITESLVQVLRLSDSNDKPAMGFLFDAMRRAREAIFENNIWNKEILEIVDRRWRDQLHQDIHAAGFFLNPQNLYSNATLDDADIMEGVRNCIYRLELDLETQMECMQQIVVRILSQTCAASSCERNWSTFQWIHAPRHNRLKTQTLHNLVYIHYNWKLREKHIKRTPINYTPINLDYIFRRDLADQWVSLRTPLLDQHFLSGAIADMNDNVNVAASNEGDMTMDMDDDYTQEKMRHMMMKQMGQWKTIGKNQPSRNVKGGNMRRCLMNRKM